MDNEVSRRVFLGSAAAATVGTMITGSAADNPPPGPAGPADPASSVNTVNPLNHDALDEALVRLSVTGPEYAGGLANHGPMASEALVTLGRPDAVEHWVDAYARHLQEQPSPRKAIQNDAWQESLGRFEQAGDWRVYFERQLAEQPWQSVLGTWAPRLAPGLAGVAMHGVIRTGHAARGLSARSTPPRLRELAGGLAYWASRFQQIPGAAGGAHGTALPSAALASVEPLPADQQIRGTLISQRLEKLAGFAPFQGVADMVDTSGDAALFLGDLSAAMAGNFLRQSRNPGALIALIHAVTGPSSIRFLLPHVDAAGRSALLRHAWQAGAAIYATHHGAERSLPPASPSIPDLVDRAVRNGDEHAIKFTEACLREHALDPRPVFLAAASEALDRLA